MKLSKPIMAHGETRNELTFREPNGADIVAHGFPMKNEVSGSHVNRLMDAKAIAGLISALAGIPPSSVAQLSVLDFTRAAGEVLDFFTEPTAEIPPGS